MTDSAEMEAMALRRVGSAQARSVPLWQRQSTREQICALAPQVHDGLTSPVPVDRTAWVGPALQVADSIAPGQPAVLMVADSPDDGYWELYEVRRLGVVREGPDHG